MHRMTEVLLRNLALALAALLILIGSSCHHREPPLSTYRGTRMTIPYKILIADAREDAGEVIDRTFTEIDQVFNQWNPESEISQLNSMPAGSTTKLSPSLCDLLSVVDRIYELSDGRYDPTVEPLVQLWKRALELGTLPSSEAIAEVRQKIGWSLLKRHSTSIHKTAAVQCNFDGIAKGHFVDRLTEELRALGYQDFYVEWGGEIRVSGAHPTGRPWRVMITGIGGAAAQGIEAVDLVDQAIATSGDYYQQWAVDGTVYTHIVDPKSGQALRVETGCIASATVLAPTCTMADALATTCMLFDSSKDAVEWAEYVQELFPSVTIWIIERAHPA